MEPAPRSGITINDSSIDRPCWDQYKDGDGILRIGGVVIKPSGSVRIGEVKIYPSGLIEVGKNIQIDGAVGAVDPVAGSNSAELADSNAAPRTVLAESSSKANVQPKTTVPAAKGKTAAIKAHNKRKSTEESAEPAKKQKTAFDEMTGRSAKTTASTSAASAPLTIDGLELDGQWEDDVPVHESCDKVRSRIEHHLLQPGVTKAQFCRDLTDQLHSMAAPTVQSNMLDAFRKKRGATAGCTSSVYYTAYVFSEKWRIVRKEAKSKHRVEMEDIWPDGVERDRDVGAKGFWCRKGETPRQDAYGRWTFK